LTKQEILISGVFLFTTGVIVRLGGAVRLVLVKTDNNMID